MKKNTRFVAYTGYRYDGGTDIREDKFAQEVVLEILRRYFDFDLKAAKLEGWVDCGVPKLHVAVKIAGEIVRSVVIDSMINGQIIVNCPTKRAYGKDPVGALSDSWLEALGFPPGYPRSEEVTIKRDGGIEISVCPSF